MSFSIQKPKGGKPTATSITTSQRSTCEVAIYRWADTDITKSELLNIAKDKSLAGGGARSNEGNLNERTPPVIIRNDIVRCNITKNKGESSGAFSLTLKRGKKVVRNQVQNQDINYLDVIHSGDWIMIYMKKSGSVTVGSSASTSGLKFVGIVENVRYIEVDDPGRGSPTLQYVVTGRDFGKVFESEIFFNPVVNNQTIQTLLGATFLQDAQKSIKGDNRAVTTGFTPDKVIKNLVSFYLGGTVDRLNSNHQTWYVPKSLATVFNPKNRAKASVSFIDMLSTEKIGLHKYNANGDARSVEIRELPGAALIKSLPSEGTVWSILEFMQNAALNEMYTELSVDKNGNLQPTLVHRQVPFSNRTNAETNPFTANKKYKKSTFTDPNKNNDKTFFDTLPYTSITSSDIRQKNVGKSDHERINHVMVVPKIDVNTATIDQLFNTAYNVPSVQRYGLRSLRTQTAYILKTGEGLGKFLQKCVSHLVDWFFLSHHLFNGTIITDGFDSHVELGTNLYISDVRQLYHIEGYSHTYEIVADGRIIYNTELRVSRGQSFDIQRRKSYFIGPSEVNNEPTTITTSVLEGFGRPSSGRA